MANERLRVAILASGLGIDAVAEKIGVDPKTVERWVAGRVPYRRHRFAIAQLLRQDEAFLWPDARTPEQITAAGQAEIVTVYPHRAVVPRDLWTRLFEQATQRIEVLVYSGFFLAEDPNTVPLLLRKASEGVRVRLLLGDPDSPEVVKRGQEEGIGEAMPAKVRNVLVLYRPLFGVENISIHLHGTTLYNSLYRSDDDMLVNTHVYGVGAYRNPVFHLRRVPGADMFSTYEESFERVWEASRPAALDQNAEAV